MALNEMHRDGVSIPYPVASNVVSGDLVVTTSGLAGVAEVSAKPNEAGNGFVATVRHDGIFGFPFASAAAVGAPVYATFTNVAGQFVKGTATLTSAAGAARIGTVAKTKGSGAGTLWVNLNRVGTIATA